MSEVSTMDVIRRDALANVRIYFQRIGLAGPTVAQAEQVIEALDEAGMLVASARDSQGAVEDCREALRLGEWEGVEMTREDMQRWAELKAKYDAPSDFPGGQ